MSKDRDGLIQDIMDSPSDDQLRLIYADWLDEHGDASLAELIRVQCQLAALPPKDRKRAALQKREKALLKEPTNAQLTEWGNEFQRGMIDQGSWYGEDPFDFSSAPLDRMLSLALDFGDSNWPGVENAQAMASAPWMIRVKRIAFHEFGTEPAVVQALAASPYLRNLREVVFSDCTTSGEALVDLLLAPSVRAVRVVLLQGDSGGWSNLTPALRRLFADPRAQQLRRFRLAALGADDFSPDVLLQAPGLQDLQLEICDRLPWVGPARAALEARFGDQIVFDSDTFMDPYGFTDRE